MINKKWVILALGIVSACILGLSLTLTTSANSVQGTQSSVDARSGSGIPAVPTLLHPTNNVFVPKPRVLLDWTDVPSATRYQVIIKVGGATDVIGLTIFNVSKVKVTLPRGKPYFWYVQACNAAGCSAKTHTWKFHN